MLAFALPTTNAEAAAKKKHTQKARSKAKAPPPIPDFDASGAPNLQSHAAFIFDQASGRTLFTKNADMPLPIASITKLMTAMVILDGKLSLDEPVVIDAADVDTVKGSKSRLPVGSAFRREDLMRLALMASDNRAAAALGRTYPGGSSSFVDAMNAKAQKLSMTNTRFVDATGLAPGNVASPHSLALMVAAASGYPQIRDFSTTPALHVRLPESGRELGFVNTNSLVRSDGWNIGVSKTGFINEAGKCLVMQATFGAQPVVIVLLDSWGRYTRMGDANRIKKWMETGRGSKIAAAPLRAKRA
jgi:D-alanyl-D-alanine endopeptidase (penicillin-binding protein 7)